MNKRLVLKLLLILALLSVVATSAFGIPNLPTAPYEGACGYMPYVASPPYYWVGDNMSYSQCINSGLPALIAFAHSHCPWCVLTETTCRPAKYCA